jgi:hypothetical protein
MLPILGGVREVWAVILGRVEGIYTMGFFYATILLLAYWFAKQLITVHCGLHMTSTL